MAKYYSDLGYSFKETLNAHVRSLGKDPDVIWQAAYDTIKEVYKAKQASFSKGAPRLPENSRLLGIIRE